MLLVDAKINGIWPLYASLFLMISNFLYVLLPESRDIGLVAVGSKVATAGKFTFWIVVVTVVESVIVSWKLSSFFLTFGETRPGWFNTGHLHKLPAIEIFVNNNASVVLLIWVAPIEIVFV